MCVTSALNILVWGWAIWIHTDLQNFSYAQPLLSGIYVLICAFRSLLPRIDLERYCLHDTPWSSVILGRSCATVAEICFSIQCAIILYDLGNMLQSQVITFVAFCIVPVIVLAQLCCWYATLTLNHFWHGMEESAWVVMIVLAAGCFFTGLLKLEGVHQIIMIIGIVSCLGSGYIMLFVDIPMYFSRTADGVSQGQQYLSVSEGIRDAAQRRVQTSDWKVWKKEVIWITTYFTFGVWLSIGMVLVDFQL